MNFSATTEGEREQFSQSKIKMRGKAVLINYWHANKARTITCGLESGPDAERYLKDPLDSVREEA